MTFDADGNFYAAQRKLKNILKFNKKGKQKEIFIDNLKDNPEFILYVPKK